MDDLRARAKAYEALFQAAVAEARSGKITFAAEASFRAAAEEGAEPYRAGRTGPSAPKR